MSPSLALFAQASGGGGNPLILLGLVFVVMYFVLIRPQQKQLKEHRALLGALKKGDDVVTQGGILGKVYAITDKLVTLEIANNVRIRVLKTSIQGKAALVDEPAAAPGKVEEKKEEK